MTNRTRLITRASSTTIIGMLLLSFVILGLGLSGAQLNAQSTDESAVEALPAIFSRDGSMLARADANGRVTVLDLESGEHVMTLGGGSGVVSALAFNHDGRLLASTKNNRITLSDLTGVTEPLFLEEELGRQVTKLAFAPQGAALAVVIDDVEIALWDTRKTPKRSVLPHPDVEGTGEIAFSFDGRFLAASGAGPNMTLWDLTADRPKPRTLSSPTGAAITGMAFSPVGSTLAAADTDANITLWDADSGEAMALSAHVDLIKQLRFSPDGAVLASEGMDTQLQLWEAASGQRQATLPARFDALVTGLAFSADGKVLASVGIYNEVHLWDVDSATLIQGLTGHTEQVRELAFSTSGETLASIDVGGRVIVWDLPSGAQRYSLPPLPPLGDMLDDTGNTPVTSLTDPAASAGSTGNQLPGISSQIARDPSPTLGARRLSSTEASAGGVAARGKHVSTGINAIAVSADGTKVAAARGQSLHHFRVDNNDDMTEATSDTLFAAASIAFSPNGKALYSAGRNSEVRRSNADTGDVEQLLLAHEHPVRAVAVAPDETLVASAGEETRIMVWSGDGKLLQILPAHRRFVNALAFSPNKNQSRLFSAGDDGLILAWDPRRRQPLRVLKGHDGPVNALSFSKNGQTLMSGGADATVRLWNPNTGKQVAILNHSASVNSTAISSNNRYLAAAGEDNRIYIWDLKSKNRLLPILETESAGITSLAFLKKGRLLVGHGDGSLSVWEPLTKQKLRQINPGQDTAADNQVEGPNVLPGTPVVQAMSVNDDSVASSAEPSEPGMLLKIAGQVLQWLIPGAHAQTLPTPNQGSGGPILIVNSASSLFGNFYSEILLTEGFNAFEVRDISELTPAVLATYRVIILAQMPLAADQVTLFSDWVNAGGNLIAMRPDPALGSLLGLTATGQTLSEGYLQVDTSNAPGRGIVAQTMQFHGTATSFSLNGATPVATLFADATSATTNPAVTLRDVGSNGGQAAAFTYDLATSIVYTRQGNPAWANQERDGFSPQRSDDKYYGNAASDPQADWIDFDKIAIPQADEQQRLLANLIVHMTSDQLPLPRFWYFPRDEKAVVIMTGDDHSNNGTAGRWDQFLAASVPGCSVADWECVRGTSYMFTNTPMTNAEAAAYEAQGFEVGLHVNTGCADFTEAQLEEYYTSQILEFGRVWPSVPAPSTQRHHCIAWTDWATSAKVQSNNGVRLDTTYYFWPPGWVEDRPGFMTGSGMPMRFADLDGSLIDVYQAASQMTDESGQQYPFTIDSLLDRALGPEGYYGAYTINAHTDLAQIQESDAVVASAQARNVPIITSRQMLEWLDGRNGSSFSSVTWDGVTLGFNIATGSGANGLRAMVPLLQGSSVVNGVTRDGSDIPFTLVTRKGIEYATFTATAGNYAVSYGVDDILPTVALLSPLDGAVDVSVNSTVSVVFNEPMNEASITESDFQLLDGQGTLVPAVLTYDAETRTATLTPSSALQVDTLYTATLISGGPTDLSGNAIVGDVSWTFTTGGGLNCPCSVWGDSDAPATASAADNGAVELGVKFQSVVDGYITGIRFYKGIGNTGSHVGNLWTATGALLSSATFTNETSTGWQQVDFPAPVPILANTTYVASYHAPNGGYALNSNYFADAVVDKPPLQLLGDVQSGGNGVYGYGASGFPSQSWNASNYWVDVVFVASIGPDTAPPTITSTSPVDGTINVPIDSALIVAFSEAMDASTVNNTSFELKDANGTLMAAQVSYDQATYSASLTPAAPLEPAANYTATVKGGTGGVADSAGNTLLADASWSFTAALADTTAPVVITLSPADSASGVSSATSLVVGFNEPLDSSTINTSTFELRDAGGTLVPGTVSYSPQAQTATFTPVGGLTADSTFTATIKGQANGVADSAGNALAADVIWSFTTALEGSGLCAVPCSLWGAAVTPSILSDPDTAAVELGVRFRSEVAGFVTGVQFYKSAQNTGTHTGSLWSSTGQLLAQGTFTNESSSGWQLLTFASPAPIQADTDYVVSYHTSAGRYSADSGYFTSAFTSGPLQAVADGAGGGNGLYLYGPGGFPTNSYNSTNYWVDPVFVTSTGPDTAPPQISTTTPADGAVNVSTVTAIVALFNESMDADTITNTTIELIQGGVPVPALVSYDAATRTATLNPISPLALGVSYTVRVVGGAGGVADTSGNPLAADETWTFTTADIDVCQNPENSIVAENCRLGNPQLEWDINGVGDPSIQGFASDISVDLGETVQFKIDTDASGYRLDIYRMGYYGGAGARKVATVQPSVGLPQVQPDCLNDATTGLIDCGNWGISASWTVPADAVSGIYFAKAVRDDNGGASHIVFIVRDDAGNSDILFQTADTTWQAYNSFGGNNLYGGSGPGSDGRAYKVSYNRPFNTRGVDGGQDWVFAAEYPMVRWLEANGYDVSYFTGVDSDRFGSLIQNHQVFLSLGHDEYWSGQQRSNVESARDAGVHLAFFSGNEVFWKTRWENGIDAEGASHRTLVCYKETHDYPNSQDPDVLNWTGTWRDPRNSPPADGGRPENALTGTLFTVNAGATTRIQVPAADGKMRFWRNTDIASLQPGQIAFLPNGTLGYEWDEDIDNGFRPPGLIRMSTTTVFNAPVLTDFGSNFGSGTATHHLTFYRHASGALVFGAGTVQWSWGLDQNYDDAFGRGGDPADVRMQQATVNLFADMDVQPATLQSNLAAATPSSDTTPPVSFITLPLDGTNLPEGVPLTISGASIDAGGGVVGGVEVSVDDGTTWHPAVGRASWSYVWTPTAPGAVTVRVRAADDSGYLESPGPGISVTIGTGGDISPPTVTDTTPIDTATGVNILTDVTATFDEAVDVATVGADTFELRDISLGLVAATVTYDGTANTATLVPNAALDAATTYTATLKGGTGGVADPAGNALATDVSWSFTTAAVADTTPPTVLSTAPADGASGIAVTAAVSATFNESVDPATLDLNSFELRDANFALVAAAVTYDGATNTATLVPNAALDAATTYTATLKGGTGGVADLAGNALATDVSWSFTTAALADTTPPTVLSTAPADGASGIAVTAAVSATFNEPVDPATLDLNSFELRDANFAPVAAAVTYDGATNTATLVPNAALTAATTYTATLKGGTGGVADPAGNALAANAVWSFTTAQSGSAVCETPCSLWDDSNTPATPSAADSGALELGVKFQSEIDGYITGIRFYKGIGNTGIHVGNLWTANGTALATAVFSNETASGWQQVDFDTPVAITAATIYIASYHAPNGGYAINTNFFGGGAVDNPPLRFLGDGEIGGNGVYQYGNGGFPSQSWNASNYWVDVVFTSNIGPDTTSPVVISTTPVDGAADVAIDASLKATFSEAMDEATISASSFELRDAANTLVPAQITYEGASNTATLTPNGVLGAATTYSATVKGGDGGVADQAFNGLAADINWSFTTAAVDTTPPIVTSSTPTDGATGVSTAANIGVAFDEPIDPTTVGTGSFELRDAGDTLVPGDLSYNVATQTLTFAPADNLVAESIYTATLTSGPSGIADPTGNTLATDVTWSFTTRSAVASVCATPCSIWGITATPSVLSDSDTNAVELGMKFQSNVAGFVTGVRFYKGSQNTGTHVGSLWSSSGQLLAQATFANETTSGWQQVDFASPVAIEASTVYVISYHTQVGRYSADSSYFSSSYSSGPLQALADGANGGNGVYLYGPGGFPSNTYGSTNYWVDVVFVTE